MDNMIYILFLSVSVPLLLMVMLVEKKARLPITYFIVGIFVSVFASELNGILYRIMDMPMSNFVLQVTPITEEIVKAIPVLFYAVVISNKRETLFTISMATGIGFAILENAFIYLQNLDNFSILSAMIRGFGTGLMHGMCTLIVGFGISFVRKRKKLFAAGTFALLSLAITYHSVFNMLIQSDMKIVGAIFPMLTYLPFFIKRNFLNKRRNASTNAKIYKNK